MSRVAFLLLSVVVIFTGCATLPEGPPYAESKAVSAKPGYAVLYVFREYAEPTAFAATVFIDGEEVSTLAQGAFTWIYVKPGARRITSNWPGISGQTPGAIDLQIMQDKTYYVAVLGQSKATVYGILGGFPVGSIKMGSGFVELPGEIAEEKLAKCCKFQKPRHQDF